MPDEEVFRGHAGHLARQDLWKHPLRVRLIALSVTSSEWRWRGGQSARPFAKRGSASEEGDGRAGFRIAHWIRAVQQRRVGPFHGRRRGGPRLTPLQWRAADPPYAT